MKNQSDGKVNDNTNFTIAINIFPAVVNNKKNIIKKTFIIIVLYDLLFSNIKFFYILIFYLLYLIITFLIKKFLRSNLKN